MIKKKLAAAAMSLGLAATAAVPAGVFAEETTAEAEETTAAEEQSSAEEGTDETEEAFDYSAGYDEKGFFKGVKALDYVTLPDYSEVRLPDTDVVPSDETVQEEIDTKLSSFSTTENLTEGTVEDGDTVNIDYVGSVDGVEFDGGSTNGEGTNVTIGVTSYIDDFLEQLIGHEPGETINVEVTFPDEYPNNPDLAGKDAVFVTTINYIVNTIVPELDDEFAKENLDFDTAEAYRQSVYDNLYQENLVNALIGFVVENSEISEVPESATQTIFDYQYEYIGSIYSMYGLSADDYLSAMGMTADDLKAQCEQYAGQILALQALMEDAGLEITREFAQEVIEADEERYNQLSEFYGENYIYNCVVPDRVASFLQENVVVYEEEETSEESSGDESEEVTGEETAAEEETETQEETETEEE